MNINPRYKFKGFVAHFDILGFKTATLRNQEEAWWALNRLRFAMDKVLNDYPYIEITATKEIIRRRIKEYYSFDTVLFYTEGDDHQDLISMTALSTQLFSHVLEFCVPLRGGVSHGEFFYNPLLNLICGVPLVKAYSIGESAQWSGMVVDDCIVEQYPEILDFISDGKPIIMQWDVPIKLKQGREIKYSTKKSWVINWPVMLKKGFEKNPPIAVQDYYEAFKSLFGPYEGLSADDRAKYENTVKFVNSTLM